ncbi:reverse transcriptase domain-containing protein, partial [Tanacetum coccineum]
MQGQINEIRSTLTKQEENLRKNLNDDMRSILGSFFQNQASTSGTLPSNTIPNPKGEMKAITTRSGVAYEGPSSIAQIPPPVIPISISELDVPKTLPKNTPIPESDIPKNLPKPNIPYPSRHDDQKSRDKASNQMEKIFQIFQDLRFNISFADALLLMPRFAPTIKSLLMNKENLLELAKIPLNENCSAMLLKKLLEKLGDPGKFLIPCNFPGMDICHALADLGASINLMPLSIWKKLSLLELTSTRMTLVLADRSVTHPKGLAENIFVKVGNFHFPTDFVVVDFEADPRVPLILGRSFLRTSRALIDVYEGELVLRDENEQITFHVNDTTKHPQKHVNESIKMVNDACKDSFKRFTDEPALVCFPPSEDVNDEKEKQEVKNLTELTVKRQTLSLVFAITSTLPSIEPKDSLIMGDEHLSTFSAEKIVPIPREYEDTFRSNSKNVLPSCEVPRNDSMTLSNPLFEFDVNFKNPLFPKSDPLRHEFTGELITTPPGIIREHEDYINRMSLLCGNSFSLSPENSHTIIESLPTSTTLVEDSDSNREEIDIFSGLDDSIPPGIESDFDSEEEIIDNLLNNDSTHERLTFNMEPDVPVINNVDELNEDECFDPGG